MNKHMRNKSNGFTLIELMVTLVVAAIVLGLAVPSFRDAIQNNKFVATSNQLVSALKYARTEALKRRTSVTVCGLNAAQDACAASTDWQTNGYGALSNGTVLRVWTDPTQYDDLTLTSSAALLVYAASGINNSGADVGIRIVFTDVTDNRCVEVSTTGRVSTQIIAAGDACP